MSDPPAYVDVVKAARLIRLGVGDEALMEMFNISYSEFQVLLEHLVTDGLLKRQDLDRRDLLEHGQTNPDHDEPEWPPSKESGIVINAAEALDCVRSGMDDAAIMERFKISTTGLQSLYKKLVSAGLLSLPELEKRASAGFQSVIVKSFQEEAPGRKRTKPRIRIHSAEALHCIRAGMTDTQIMRAYDLTAKGLRGLFRKLADKGDLTDSELSHRLKAGHRSIDLVQDDAAGAHTHSAPKKSRTGRVEPQAQATETGNEGKGITTERVKVAPRGSQLLEIRHKSSGEVIFSGPALSMKALVESAVSARVDLSEADLTAQNLAGADLSGALLRKVDMTRANLVGANFTGARLSEATLVSAEMCGANLDEANFNGADLSDSNMTMVHGKWTFLRSANLSESNMTNANLEGPNLAGANLFQTILDGASFPGAYLEGAEFAERPTTKDRTDPDTSDHK